MSSYGQPDEIFFLKGKKSRTFFRSSLKTEFRIEDKRDSLISFLRRRRCRARTSGAELPRGRGVQQAGDSLPTPPLPQHVAVFCTLSPANHHSRNSVQKLNIKSTEQFETEVRRLTISSGHVGQNSFGETVSASKASL